MNREEIIVLARTVDFTNRWKRWLEPQGVDEDESVRNIRSE